jgi:hypothetical protein
MDGYQILLRELKERIRTARLQAALAVNQELVLLYWGIGREIMERQAREKRRASGLGENRSRRRRCADGNRRRRED